MYYEFIYFSPVRKSKVVVSVCCGWAVIHIIIQGPDAYGGFATTYLQCVIFQVCFGHRHLAGGSRQSVEMFSKATYMDQVCSSARSFHRAHITTFNSKAGWEL